MSTQKNLIEILINLIDKSAPGLASASKNLKSFGEGADKLGKSMMKAGGVTAGALIGIVKVTSTAGDELAKFSKRSGVAVETLAELKFAAEQSGSSWQAISVGIRTAAVQMYQASQGMGESVDLFRDLGISIYGANGQLKNVGVLIPEVATKIQGMTDDTLAMAYAQKLFGRGGGELLPLLREGADGIRALQKEYRDLGGWTAKSAKLAEELNDSFGRVKTAMQSAAIAIMNGIGPALDRYNNKLAREIIPNMAKWIEKHGEMALATFKFASVLFGVGGLIVGLGMVATNLGVIISLAPKVVAAFAAMKAAAVAAGITSAGTALAAGAAVGAPMVGGYLLARESVGKGQRNTALAPVGAEGIGPLIMNAIFDLAQRSADKIKGTSLSGLDALPSFMGIAGQYAVEKVEAAGEAVKKWATALELAVGKLAIIGDPQLKDFGLEGIFAGGKFDEALAKIVENADPFKRATVSGAGMPVGPEVPSQYESEWRNQQKRAGRAQAADPWAQLAARMTEAKTGIQTWLDTIQGAVENVGNRIGNVFGDAFMSGKLSLKDFGAAFKATMADVIAQIVAASVKMAAFNLIIKLAGGGSPLSFSDAPGGNSGGSGAGVGMDPITKAARGPSMRQNTDSTSMLKTGLDNLASKFDNLASVVVQIPGAPVLIDGRAAGRTLLPWMMEAQARGQ